MKFDAKKCEKLKPVIGEGFVYFDRENHKYYDEKGRKMISGSEYAGQQFAKFDGENIAENVANYYGWNKNSVIDLWDLKRDYGTIIHKAIELYALYGDMVFAKLPADIISIVKSCGVDMKNVTPEAFVRYKNHCGFIDLLQFRESDNSFHIYDWKINDKKDEQKVQRWTYQQNFYRDIIEKCGRKVNGMTIKQYNGEWHDVELAREEIRW